MATDIFQSKETMADDGYNIGMCKTAQTPAESRDAPLPGLRSNSALGVQNIRKSAPATGRRP